MRASIHTTPHIVTARPAFVAGLPAAKRATEYFDVVDDLLGQHDEIRRLGAGVQRSRGAELTRRFADLRAAVRRHERDERAIIHSVVRRSGTTGDLVGAARMLEEDAIAAGFADLCRLGPGHPRSDAGFASLYRLVLEHLTREELDEFPLLRLDVPARQLRAMADELRRARTVSAG